MSEIKNIIKFSSPLYTLTEAFRNNNNPKTSTFYYFLGLGESFVYGFSAVYLSVHLLNYLHILPK